MKTKLVIFDLDGTLLDTISDLGEACNYALKTLDMPTHPIDAYRKMVGNGFRKLVERCAPEANEETVEQLVRLSRDYYDEHCMVHTHPYPGIPELLRKLEEKNIWLAVASNKYQSAVERIVAYYFPDIRFVAIEGQREGRPIKPDPAVIDSILKICPVDKSEVLMVGDSLPDIMTAKNAGIRVAAVSWGFSPLAELEEAGPDEVVTNPEQILENL